MRKIKKYGIYRHFKGNHYIVLDICKNSEDLEDYVLYKGLYGKNDLWIRPLDLFLSEVDHKRYPIEKQKYRFELIDLSEEE